MIIKSLRSKISIMIVLIAAVIASNHGAFAGTIKVKGSDSGTFVTVNFTYDGVAAAHEISYAGSDNIGGPFTGQIVSEVAFTASSCTAPDDSVGTVFVPVKSTEVDTYNQGQLYSSGAGAAAGSGCASNTTGSFSSIETLSITGGTGKFADASGSLTHTSTGTILAAPGSPPGKFRTVRRHPSYHDGDCYRLDA